MPRHHAIGICSEVHGEFESRQDAGPVSVSKGSALPGRRLELLTLKGEADDVKEFLIVGGRDFGVPVTSSTSSTPSEPASQQ